MMLKVAQLVECPSFVGSNLALVTFFSCFLFFSDNSLDSFKVVGSNLALVIFSRFFFFFPIIHVAFKANKYS